MIELLTTHVNNFQLFIHYGLKIEKLLSRDGSGGEFETSCGAAETSKQHLL